MAVGCHDEGAWCKALAVADALAQTHAEVVVVADADVWCDGLAEAVENVQAGAPWAVPHRGVHRLTEGATSQVLTGAPWEGMATCERPYLGVLGGGIVAIRRDVLEDCPLDPRFHGWGSEDESWGMALTALHGPASRGKRPLVHLWHPPQPRVERSFGCEASRALRKRYARAIRKPEALRQLIEEARQCHSRPC